MNDVVARLAYTRSVEAGYKAEVAAAQAELENSSIWEYLEQQRVYWEIARADVADAEAEVRRQALTVYAETTNKAPHPAVKIKMYTVLDYDDGEALDYARVYIPRAVKLDERKFEQAAKVLEPDFVTVRQEPRATIARDLSKYLPIEEG